MPPDANGSFDGHEIVEVAGEPGTPSGTVRLVDFIPIDIYIPSVEVEHGALRKSRWRKPRFLDFLRAHPSKDWFLRSTFVGRLRRRRSPHHHHHDAPADSSPDDGPRRVRFRVPFVRKIRWAKLWAFAVSWCRKPENLAMIIWLAFVGAGLLLLFLLMTGMLDDAIPDDERRKDWTEATNQILNALFTIMCLYQHPKIAHHLVLLLRWRPDGGAGDREEIRKAYCKDGAARPRDRAHMLVVVTLLHATCFAQYYCCALFWAYSRKDRPDWALNIGYGVGVGCPIIAGLYTAYGPLARKETADTEAAQAQDDRSSRRAENDGGGDVEIKIYNRRVVVSSPEWSGALFDCCDDGTVCALSATCTFCVFGWNMERLGFGNMYVHAFTFILLCVAPFIIFSATALNVHDDGVRDTLVAVGVLLGFCGLLYGGFWRTQMRRRYKFPGERSWWCGGSAAVGDCAKWLFCWSCALAQEVRTANFYDVVEDDRFVAVSNGEGRPVLVPLPREASTTTYYYHTRSMSSPPMLELDDAAGVATMSPLGREMVASAAAAAVMERSATYHPPMRPPLPPLMQTERQE